MRLLPELGRVMRDSRKGRVATGRCGSARSNRRWRLPRTLAGKLTDRIGPRPVVLAGMAIAAAGTVPFALAGAHTSELLLSLVLVVRGAGLTTANMALMAGAFTGLPRESVPDASSVTRIMQQVGGSFGTAVLAVILVGPSFQATFWWSVAFTALAVLPAAMLPARRAAAQEQSRASQGAEAGSA